MNFAGILDQRRAAPVAAPSYTLTVDFDYLQYDLDGVPCLGDSFNISTDAGNNWTITNDRPWITCIPTSGSGNRNITVEVFSGVEAAGGVTITSFAPTVTVGVDRTIACY